MTSPVLDADEKIVEEVHCSECGVPIPAIPNWYAQVRVKFACDTCRQKSPRLAVPPAALAVAAARPAAAVVGDADEEVALDEVDVDAADDLEIEDTEEVADEE